MPFATAHSPCRCRLVPLIAFRVNTQSRSVIPGEQSRWHWRLWIFFRGLIQRKRLPGLPTKSNLGSRPCPSPGAAAAAVRAVKLRPPARNAPRCGADMTRSPLRTEYEPLPTACLQHYSNHLAVGSKRLRGHRRDRRGNRNNKTEIIRNSALRVTGGAQMCWWEDSSDVA